MTTRALRSDRYKLKTTFDGDHTTIHTSTVEGAAETQTRWRRKKDIGTGGSGIVWLEEEEGVGKRLRAVKRLHQVTKGVDWSRELNILAQLGNHQELFVEFLGWYEDRNFVYLAMEFIEHGDLSQYLRKFGSEVMSQAKDIVTQLLKGLVVLHEGGICHRDIKPNNILIASTSPIWVKIADFGVSKNQENTSLYTRCGTLDYLAPELHGYRFKSGDSKGSGNTKKRRRRRGGNPNNGPSYTNTIDIWSLGILTHKVLTLEVPFLATYLESGSESEQELGLGQEQESLGIDVAFLFKYCDGEQVFPTESLLKSKVSSQGIEFVKELLVADPCFRMPAAQALKSPWLLEKRPEPYYLWEAQEREKGEEARLARQKQDREQIQVLEGRGVTNGAATEFQPKEEDMTEEQRIIQAEARRRWDNELKEQKRIELERQLAEIQQKIAEQKKRQEGRARRRARKAEPEYKEQEAGRSRERSKVRENEAKKARREEVEYIRKNAGLDSDKAGKKESKKERYSTSDPLPSRDIPGFTERSWFIPNGVPRLIETPPTPPPGMPRFLQRIHREGSYLPRVSAEVEKRMQQDTSVSTSRTETTHSLTSSEFGTTAESSKKFEQSVASSEFERKTENYSVDIASRIEPVRAVTTSEIERSSGITGAGSSVITKQSVASVEGAQAASGSRWGSFGFGSGLARAVTQAISNTPSIVTGKPFSGVPVAPVPRVPNLGAAVIDYKQKSDSQQYEQISPQQQQQELQYSGPQLPPNFSFKESVYQDSTTSESQSQSIYKQTSSNYSRQQASKTTLSNMEYGPAPQQIAYGQGATISAFMEEVKDEDSPKIKRQLSQYELSPEAYLSQAEALAREEARSRSEQKLVEHSSTLSSAISAPTKFSSVHWAPPSPTTVQERNDQSHSVSRTAPASSTSGSSRTIVQNNSQQPSPTLRSLSISRTSRSRINSSRRDSSVVGPTENLHSNTPSFPDSGVGLDNTRGRVPRSEEEEAEFMRTKRQREKEEYEAGNRGSGRRERSAEPRQSFQRRSTEQWSRGQPLDRPLPRRSTEQWTAERQSMEDHQLQRRSTDSTLMSHEQQPTERHSRRSIDSVRRLQESYAPDEGTDINEVEGKAEAESPSKARSKMQRVTNLGKMFSGWRSRSKSGSRSRGASQTRAESVKSLHKRSVSEASGVKERPTDLTRHNTEEWEQVVVTPPQQKSRAAPLRDQELDLSYERVENDNTSSLPMTPHDEPEESRRNFDVSIVQDMEVSISQPTSLETTAPPETLERPKSERKLSTKSGLSGILKAARQFRKGSQTPPRVATEESSRVDTDRKESSPSSSAGVSLYHDDARKEQSYTENTWAYSARGDAWEQGVVENVSLPTSAVEEREPSNSRLPLSRSLSLKRKSTKSLRKEPEAGESQSEGGGWSQTTAEGREEEGERGSNSNRGLPRKAKAKV